jgi:PAS domain S-box-containing protein
MTPAYDKAWAKYQYSIKIIPTPLVSWDFFQPQYSDSFLINNIQKKWNEKIDFFKVSNIENREIIVTDKNLKIIFATETIKKMNGYKAKEIIGKSPSFFQGTDTCVTTKLAIKNAIQNLKPFKEVILNYKKNGDTYWCEIEAYPKFDKQGNFVNYIAFEKLAS